jgi:hypothetical protein
MASRQSDSPKRVIRRIVTALAGAFLALALAGCIETMGDDEILPVEPGKLRLAQAAAKPPSAKANAAAKAGLPEQVRTRLRQKCISEHAGPFRIDAASDAQCECYASTVVKSLRGDELEFYMTYNVVPTLSGTRPENVKQSCGIKLLDQSGSRSRPPAPAPN